MAENLAAPIEKGQQTGEMRIVSGGETLLSVPVAAAEAVDALTIPDLFGRMLGALLGGQEEN